MKTIATILIGVIAAGAAWANTNGIATALQKGLFEEEVNRDVVAAISAYESAVAQFDKDRQLAATAIFRLAESYRRAGRTKEAQGLYQRIVNEFPDSGELAALSQPHLPAAAPSAGDHLLPGEADEIRGIRTLLRTSPDAVNAPDNEGVRPLNRAARDGKLGLVRFLIENGAALDFPDGAQMTALHHAAARGHNSIVEVLLDNGARLDARDHVRATPLLHAVNNGMLGVAETLLKRGAATDVVVLRDNRGIVGAVNSGSALQITAERSFFAMAKLLLDHGADPNLLGRGNLPALESAVRLGRHEFIKLFLERGANPNARDSSGRTSLHSAVERGDKEAAEMLLRAGVDPNMTDEAGDTVLHFAVKSAKPDIVKLLLADGADVNARNAESATPAKVALQELLQINQPLLQFNQRRENFQNRPGLEESFRILLETGADTDGLLVSAVSIPWKLAVEMLLERGEDPNRLPALQVDPGLSLLDFAVIRDRPEFAQIAELLRQHGARRNSFWARIARDQRTGTTYWNASEPRTIRSALGSRMDQIEAIILMRNGQSRRIRVEDLGDMLLEDGDRITVEARKPSEPTDEQAAVERIKTMLQQSPDLINAPQGESRETLLHQAAGANQLDVAEFFLRSGARVNETGMVNRTPLHTAVANGHRAMVAFLLDHGADIDAIGTWGGEGAPFGITRGTPLHIATVFGYRAVAEELLKRGASTSTTEPRGQTPLTIASILNRPEMTKLLLDHGADPNLFDNRVDRHPAIAYQNPDADMPRFLPEGDGNLAPLHAAIAHGNREVGRILLEGGAEVNLRTSAGESPLHMAVRRRNLEIIRLLIDHGADVNARGHQDASVLHLAVWEVEIPAVRRSPPDPIVAEEIFRLLLDRGANVNANGRFFGTPLYHAVNTRNRRAVELLLQRGADPDVQNDAGRAALHFAAEKHVHGAVELLLKNGANPNILDKNLHTPLDLALRTDPPVVRSATDTAPSRSKSKTVELLEQHGAHHGETRAHAPDE